MRTGLITAVTAALTLAVTGCGGDNSSGKTSPRARTATDGDTATWTIDSTHPPATAGRTFTALVTRLGCSGGKTGHVLPPSVIERGDRVVVTFEVNRLPKGLSYTCQGNLPEPYSVPLRSPLEDRRLIDGACLLGQAATTSDCASGAQRWPADD